MELNKTDLKLIEQAKKVINANSDLKTNNRELVASIILAKSGKTYKGVNIKTSHSICAEQVALGQAMTCGEREFDTIVSVILNKKGDINVVSPCGVCRYTFDKLNLDINVIVRDEKSSEIYKVKSTDLLPYQYKREN